MSTRRYWVGLLVGFVIVLGFQYSLASHIYSPVGLIHGDSFLVYFILKHWMHVFTTLQWQQVITMPMFFGYEGSLFFTDHHFLVAVFTYPLFLLSRNIVFSAHVIVILTIIASFISMYTLIWHMTKSAKAGIISGILFVLNPFIFARYPDQLNLLSLQWIPLIFLFFELAIRTPRSTYLLWFFIALSAQLLTSLNYSVMVSVVLPVYMVIRSIQERFQWWSSIHIWTVIGCVLFVLTAGLTRYSYQRVYEKYPLNRSVEVAKTYAAIPSDWLFTSELNVLYGGLKQAAAARFPHTVRIGIYAEHSLFPGIVMIVFVIASVFLSRIFPDRNRYAVLVAAMLFAWVLSLGPAVWTPGGTGTHWVYGLLYRLNPYLHDIRATSRFAVFVYFFAAWIAAYVWQYVEKRVSGRVAACIAAVVIGLILMEYWNKPLEFTEISPGEHAVYGVIQERDDIRVILEYPIGNRISYPFPQARSEDLDARYLLWATLLHSKTLFNGYSGFIPEEYYLRANALSVNFPTDEKLALLQQWGVDAIIVHRNEFVVSTQFDSVCTALKSRGVPILIDAGDDIVFDLTAWSGR